MASGMLKWERDVVANPTGQTVGSARRQRRSQCGVAGGEILWRGADEQGGIADLQDSRRVRAKAAARCARATREEVHEPVAANGDLLPSRCWAVGGLQRGDGWRCVVRPRQSGAQVCLAVERIGEFIGCRPEVVPRPTCDPIRVQHIHCGRQASWPTFGHPKRRRRRAEHVRVVRLERDHTAAEDAEAAAHLIRTVGTVRAAPLLAAAIVTHVARPTCAARKPRTHDGRERTTAHRPAHRRNGT